MSTLESTGFSKSFLLQAQMHFTPKKRYLLAGWQTIGLFCLFSAGIMFDMLLPLEKIYPWNLSSNTSFFLMCFADEALVGPKTATVAEDTTSHVKVELGAGRVKFKLQLQSWNLCSTSRQCFCFIPGGHWWMEEIVRDVALKDFPFTVENLGKV